MIFHMKVFMGEFICFLEFASKCTRKKGGGVDKLAKWPFLEMSDEYIEIHSSTLFTFVYVWKFPNKIFFKK